MQATYDLRKSSIQPFTVTFAVLVSLIVGGVGGFALRGVSESTASSQAAPVIATAPAATLSVDTHRAQNMLRLEIQDQQAQAGATAAQASSDQPYSARRTGPQ